MLEIKVVGTGCPNCIRLENMCKEVIREFNIDANLVKVSDLNEIAALGIFLTPALIINNEVKISGKLPTPHTLRHWIADAAGTQIS